jgi:hypothetical protein
METQSCGHIADAKHGQLRIEPDMGIGTSSGVGCVLWVIVATAPINQLVL